MDQWKEKIIGIFNATVSLTSEEQESLAEGWHTKPSLKRNDFLIRKDETETNLFYIISGSLRIYYPVNDDEICVGFAYDHNLICSYPSFIRQQPSAYYIQALSACDIAAIARKDFYALFDRFPKIERAWRMLQEEALVGKIERETELLTFTPEERYNRLMSRSPHIFRIIPRKYIASYLRMTPETLSRIRPS